MSRRLIAAIASVSMALGLAGATIAAQDSATPEVTEDSVPRPAHIHTGTCEELGDVVYPLEDVADVTIAARPVASPIVEQVASPDVTQGEVVIESITEVDVTLNELLAGEHAVNVHESAEDIGTYIACGDVAGEVDDEGRLTIALEELNDSGWAGSAVLEQTSPGVTTVTITLQDQGVPATPGS